MRLRLAGKAAVFMGVAGLFFTSPAVAQPNVVVSIPPLHSLVAGVMEGVGKPTLLVKGGASPHTYALRPSDARALEDADLIVWIGEDLERFLAKPVSALGTSARSLETMNAPGVHLLYPAGQDEPAGEVHEHENEHGREHAEATVRSHEDHDDDHGHHHDPNSANPHIWLSPENAKAIVSAVADALEAADPENAARYRSNQQNQVQRLEALSADMHKVLAPVAEGHFVVFHDAYRYFAEAFGLRQVGAITVNPDRMPGARHLSELRQKVLDLGATCIFREPQFTPKLAEAIVSGTSARLGILDPLGAGLETGPDLYFRLMRGNAQSLADCLGGKTAG